METRGLKFSIEIENFEPGLKFSIRIDFFRSQGPLGGHFGVFFKPFGPRAPECPESVPRVSPECQNGVPDTPGTLSGHFLDTPERWARRAPKTPRETPVAGLGVRNVHKK